MMLKKITALIQETPIISILRGVTPDEIIGVCDVLRNAGLKMVEIPLNSPDAIESIRRAAAKYHADDAMQIGAGTVLTPENVNAVAQAGGRYIISPNTDPDVIKATKAAGLISMPGFLTPSEGFIAIKAGADFLKLFPAAAMGVGYIKDLKAVIKAPILAVGGIGEKNIAEYLTVCAGCGIGSSLYKPGKTLEQLAVDAAALLKGIQK